VIGSVDAWGFGDVDVEMVGWGIHFFLSACSLLKVDFNPLCNVTNKISTTNSFFFFFSCTKPDDNFRVSWSEVKQHLLRQLQLTSEKYSSCSGLCTRSGREFSQDI
jgi:hypothetical protein